MKTMKKRFLGILLSLAMVLGMMPELSLKAHATAETLTSAITTWNNSDGYTVTDDVTIGSTVYVTASTSLNIPADKTVTVNGQVRINSNVTLTVNGSGTLTVNGPDSPLGGREAFYTDGDGSGTLVVNGGTVNATGGNGGKLSDFAATPGGVAIKTGLTVNGGTVNATGGNGGDDTDANNGGFGAVGINGQVTINGGTVNATGGNGGSGTRDYGSGAVGIDIRSDKPMTINGGTVIAAGGTCGYASESAVSNMPTAGDGMTLVTKGSDSAVPDWSTVSDVYNDNRYGCFTVEASTPPTTYTVTYDAGEGSGEMTDSNSPYDSGATVNVLANGFTEPANKVFAGFKIGDGTTIYANASDNITGAGSSFTITEDTTLTAQWADADNTSGYSVTITPGSNMTRTEGSGDALQTGLSGVMTDVVYTVNDGYYFPENYVVSCTVTANSGISVTRNSYTQITVSGTPTADAEVTLTAPTAKTTPATPTTAAAVKCTTSANNDGKLTGVTTEMEYRKLDAADWTAGTGSDITGLVPGIYYVRVKATDTTNASGNQVLRIAAADSAYGAYLVKRDDDAEALAGKRVEFNGYPWYIIADNSTGATAGTLTLLAADTSFGVSKFNESRNDVNYSGSKIATVLAAYTNEGGSFYDVADAVKEVKLRDADYMKARLYIPSVAEVEPLKYSQALQVQFSDSVIPNTGGGWWLRTAGTEQGVAYVRGNSGVVESSGEYFVTHDGGVRPALQLDLAYVNFSPDTRTFTPKPYIGLIPMRSDNTDKLAAKVVSFDNKEWYIVADDSTALNAGTLTLLSKECVAASQFDENGSNTYSGSTVESVVNNWYRDNITAAAQRAVDGNGMFLLSVDQAEAIKNSAVNSCPQYSGSEKNRWWLCTPSRSKDDSVACVNSEYGSVDKLSTDITVAAKLGVRPALKLNLASVIFSSDTKIFMLKPSGYSVTITPGSNMTKTEGSGDALQTGVFGAMTDVVYTANDGYYFPTDYSVTAVNEVSVTRNSYTQITVSGTPTADATITLTAPTEKTTPDTPTSAAAVNCTTADNNDGKLTGVTAAMEYQKSGATSWTAGTGSDITGLVPGTYYVRVKATDTTNASGNQELTIEEYTTDPYASLKNTTTAVHFDSKDWYLIDYDASTVTLLAKECVGASKYDSNGSSNTYSGSTVETFVNTWYTDNISADAKTAVSDDKMFLLTTAQATAITNVDVRKCSKASGAAGNVWWLCSPGKSDVFAACVDGDGGYVGGDGTHVRGTFGVRPALKLNLSSVIFSSESKTFTVKPAASVTKAPTAKSPIYNGSAQELVNGGEAEGGTLYYALGENAETAPEFDGDSEAADKKWNTTLPKASAVGTYYVWYMLKGDANHSDTTPVCITVKIGEAAHSPSSYLVRFDLGGHGIPIVSQTVKNGEKVKRPTDPTATGFVFDGWYTDQACTVVYNFDTPVKKSFTLYAKWTENSVESVTVSFDMQKHGEQVPSQTIPAGTTAQKPQPDPVAEDYTFGGWYTSPECKAEELYDFATPVNADLTLYAKWTAKAVPAYSSALNPVPEIEADTTELYLVKGQKFIIGKEWSVKKDDKTSKALVSISKKSGQLKAKKDGTATIWNGDRSLVLHISAPSVPKKLALQITADGAESRAIELKNPDELPVCWFSASPDVAAVDQDGNVTAVSAGKTKVTAYINGSAYNCSVSVKEAVPARKRTLHMAVGAKKNLSIKGVKNLLWSSADEEIASFDKKKLTANIAGETTLTATAADGTEYLVHLFVEDLTLSGEGLVPQTKKNGKLIANKYTLTIKAGESTELSFAAVDQAVVFKSSKPDSAFIDENGKVSARTAGKSKFTAKVDGKSITISVVVE